MLEFPLFHSKGRTCGSLRVGLRRLRFTVAKCRPTVLACVPLFSINATAFATYLHGRQRTRPRHFSRVSNLSRVCEAEQIVPANMAINRCLRKVSLPSFLCRFVAELVAGVALSDLGVKESFPKGSDTICACCVVIIGGGGSG